MSAEVAATPPEMRVNACKWCGAPLDRTRPWQEYCGDLCRYRYNNDKRRTQTRSPPSGGADAAGEIGQELGAAHHTPRAPIRKGTKIARILGILALGRSLNRFEAEPIGDHCLHSTVAAIEHRFGVRVDRHDETVPGYRGNDTRVVRYHLDDEQRNAARQLLEGH